MLDLQTELDDAVLRLRVAGTDLQTIEVKSGEGGLPKSLPETISAFANARGGMLLLGLSETDGFNTVPIDAAKLAADLGAVCAEHLDPPVRADIDIAEVEGQPVVVALVDELPPDQKPCYVISRGVDRGSYIRTHDGDRRLSTYEVHVLSSSKGQPVDDTVVVPDAALSDLDPDRVGSLLRRLRANRGNVFSNVDDATILRMMGVTANTDSGPGITLVGLLALGIFPQQFVPQLNVTFVAFATRSGQPMADGTRFLDNQSIDGPIASMVSETLAAMRRNMKRRGIVVGLGREDRWEYPEEAIREIVANALMHRDYHSLAHGSQVRVELYPDRLVVSSPGGIYGPVAREDLMAEPVSSSRNARLAKLLEDVEIGSTGRTVCENRGTGLLAMAGALRDAGIEPPTIDDFVREFRVTISNHGLLDDEAVEWLSTLDTAGLGDRQRLALAYLRRKTTITNREYRSLSGCDSLTATRELTGLASTGLIDKTSDRRWTVWRLVDEASSGGGQQSLEFVSSGVSQRRDRRPEIRKQLGSGPKSALEMSNTLGLTKQGLLVWLRRMEDEGVVRITCANRRSPNNKWELVSE